MQQCSHSRSTCKRCLRNVAQVESDLCLRCLKGPCVPIESQVGTTTPMVQAVQALLCLPIGDNMQALLG